MMKRRAEQEAEPGQTPEQAFAKFMETPSGRDLYAAYKALPADTVVPFVAKLAPAAEAVETRAEEIRKGNPRLSIHQARAQVYSESPALLKRAMAEVRGEFDGPEAA